VQQSCNTAELDERGLPGSRSHDRSRTVTSQRRRDQHALVRLDLSIPTERTRITNRAAAGRSNSSIQLGLRRV
jgi:hypothetical protein